MNNGQLNTDHNPISSTATPTDSDSLHNAELPQDQHNELIERQRVASIVLERFLRTHASDMDDLDQIGAEDRSSMWLAVVCVAVAVLALVGLWLEGLI